MSNEAALNLYQSELDDLFVRAKLFTITLEKAVAAAQKRFPDSMPRDGVLAGAVLMLELDQDKLTDSTDLFLRGIYSPEQYRLWFVRQLQRNFVIERLEDEYTLSEDDMQELENHLPEIIV